MADDVIQSFLAAHEQRDNVHIPHPTSVLPCCCGNTACAYLKHNQSALESLERNVRTAAQLGQALLVRHEAYMADAEQQRKAMSEHIENLESEKHELEAKNSAVTEENRNLLDQLEIINSAVSDSDAHVTGLQATLQSTQQELQKLSHLANRAQDLERQLEEYEKEQAAYQAQIATKDESERAAVRRWHQAERNLASMQEQLERIEQEAKEEKERHVEVVGRMERRHAVEKELDSVAGRLKGAAALKTTNGRENGGTNVVSHFVKDILQDNANLQMGIVELRELLQNSNEEVETLRDQLSLHQPLDDRPDDPPTPVPKESLSDEMNKAASQELHVHHHYHAPPSASKASSLRRPKKKRYGTITPCHFTPPSGSSTPRTSVSRPIYGTPSSATTILNQTSVSVPQQPSQAKRWSPQSTQTNASMAASSGPSSPQSTSYRTSSFYDRIFSDDGHASSRPTTPDSEGPSSPFFTPMTSSKHASRSLFRTYSTPLPHRSLTISPGANRPLLGSIMDASVEELSHQELTGEDRITEENEADWQDTGSPPLDLDSSVVSPMTDESSEPTLNNHNFYEPSLRRAASYGSLLSVRGMDIHILKPRPSQLLAFSGPRAFTSQAVVSETTAHAARPINTLPNGTDRSLYLLSSAAQARQAPRTLSKKASGWLFGRWGATPAPTVTSRTDAGGKAAAVAKTPARPPSAHDPERTPRKAKLRPKGINQSGPISGMGHDVRMLHAPVTKALDEEALRKALDDD